MRPAEWCNAFAHLCEGRAPGVPGQRFSGLFSSALKNYRYDPRAIFIYAITERGADMLEDTVRRIADNGNVATLNFYSQYDSADPLKIEAPAGFSTPRCGSRICTPMLTSVLAALALLYLALALVVLRAMAIRYEGVGFGFGPRLWSWQIGDWTFVLKALPIASYVHSEEWRHSGWVRQQSAALLPWLIMFLLAVPVLGVDGVLTAAKSAWLQVLAGVYPHFGGGADLIGRFLALLAVDTPRALAVLLVKNVMLHLLPFPNLPIGVALQMLLRIPHWMRALFAWCTMLLWFVFIAGWGWSLGRYAAHVAG